MSETFVVDEKTGKSSIVKDPDAVLDYTFDWTAWLALNGDAISTHAASIENAADAGGVIDSSLVVGDKVTVWVSGGTAGKTMTLRCRITTNNTPARIDDRTVYLKVKAR